MAYTLNTELLQHAPKVHSFGQMKGPYKYVTIHNSAGKGDARAVAMYAAYSSPEVSYHFAIDESEAYQIMPVNWTAWHAGDGQGSGNMESIAIEIARDMDYTSDLYARAEENAALLAAELLKEQNLGTDSLKRHYDWNKKPCPHRMFEVEQGKTTGRTWEQFKYLVGTFLKTDPKPKPGTPEKSEAFLVYLDEGTEIRPQPPMQVDHSTYYTITETSGSWG